MSSDINRTVHRMANRIHSLDALRAIAMLLGVVLHASISYRVKPVQPWPFDDSEHLMFYDYLYLFLHSFRMQIFYLVAGFFARLLYLKIDARAFIWHRTKRIVFPLIISIIILAPLSMATFIYYKYWLLHPNETPGNILLNISQYVFKWNGIAHLWFLYYLCLYYITILLFLAFKKKFNFIIQLLDFYFSKATTQLGLRSFMFLIIPLTSILCLQSSLPIEPYTGLTIRVQLYLYYGLFFILGYAIHRYNFNELRIYSKNSILFLLIGISLTPLVSHLYTLQNSGSVDIGLFLIVRFVAGCQTILLVFGFLGFFLKYMSAESFLLRYISDASYWIYLVHLPLVVGMQIWLIKSSINPSVRFWIVTVVSTVIPMLTYALFVRYTIIGRFLNGPRQRNVRFQKERLSTMTPELHSVS